MNPRRTAQQVENEFIGRTLRTFIEWIRKNPLGAVLLGFAIGGATGTGALPATQRALGFGTASDIQEIKSLLQAHVHESQAVHRSMDSSRVVNGLRVAAIEKRLIEGKE